MSQAKSWAPGWKTTYGPKRKDKQDAFEADFEDRANNKVRVCITIQYLKGFGEKPLDSEEVVRHTETVLRAILEAYVEKRVVTPISLNCARMLSRMSPSVVPSYLAPQRSM